MRKWDVIDRIIICHDKLIKTIMIGQARVYEFSGTFAGTRRHNATRKIILDNVALESASRSGLFINVRYYNAHYIMREYSRRTNITFKYKFIYINKSLK